MPKYPDTDPLTPAQLGRMKLYKGGKETAVATIRASCPTCGDVELTTKDVTVQVCSNNNQGAYAFQCPSCRVAVSKSAEPRIIDLLVSSGVKMTVWRMPAELEEEKLGEPIGYDDLLSFHYELQQQDWLERMIERATPLIRPADSTSDNA